MRDTFSDEVARTLYPLGFYKKFRDRGWNEQQQDPGLADGVFITALNRGQGAFIEAKTGDGTNRERFPYEKWSPRQREFAVACAWSGIPYYIFLTMGGRIGGTKYPRVAYLITGAELAKEEVGSRKSISYDAAAQAWTSLIWKGQGRWELPDDHSFWKVVDGFYYSDTAIRTRRTPRSFWSGGYTSTISAPWTQLRSQMESALTAELLKAIGAGSYSNPAIPQPHQPDRAVSFAGDGSCPSLP